MCCYVFNLTSICVSADCSVHIWELRIIFSASGTSSDPFQKVNLHKTSFNLLSYYYTIKKAVRYLFYPLDQMQFIFFRIFFHNQTILIFINLSLNHLQHGFIQIMNIIVISFLKLAFFARLFDVECHDDEYKTEENVLFESDFYRLTQKEHRECSRRDGKGEEQVKKKLTSKGYIKQTYITEEFSTSRLKKRDTDDTFKKDTTIRNCREKWSRFTSRRMFVRRKRSKLDDLQ